MKTIEVLVWDGLFFQLLASLALAADNLSGVTVTVPAVWAKANWKNVRQNGEFYENGRRFHKLLVDVPEEIDDDQVYFSAITPLP